MLNTPPRLLCKICERRRPITSFSRWGMRDKTCKWCERGLMELIEKDLSEMSPDTDHLETPEIEAEKNAIPYDEIDDNMVWLVRSLNRFPGLLTMGCCGGHDVITNPSQWPAGTWYVKFSVPMTHSGWFLLEHLAWAINNDYRESGNHVVMLPKSPPPYLNRPGKCLAFVIEGFLNENPDDLAEFLDQTRDYMV